MATTSKTVGTVDDSGSNKDHERAVSGLPFPVGHCLGGLERQVAQLIQTGQLFYQRGWSVGTSSNYSVILDRNPLELLVTASGMHKGRLRPSDFVRINDQGRPIVPDQPKSSAETLLHVVAAQHVADVGCVLHTHSVWGTLLSDRFFEQGYVPIDGFEMLKGLEGIKTHETQYRLPIFENTQDIPVLADQVGEWLEASLADAQPGPHGYLIRKHGLYTWGRNVEEAQRHIEIFEFLLECVGRQLMMGR